MKIINFILILLVNATVLQGQTNKKELSENPCKTAGVYYAYPDKDIKRQAPPPKGYEPFYISHFGRHGSRYLVKDSEYKWILDVFEDANNRNALTPLGVQVYKRLQQVWEEAQGRGSSLSPLGVRQQRGIAERMYKSFQRVFTDSLYVSACATVVPRCILSMDAFCERLKELNPTLQMKREADDRHMHYLDHYTEETQSFKANNSWREGYKKFEKEHVNPDRIINTLFSDKEYLLKAIKPESVMWSLFTIAGNMQNMDTDLTFYDLFTQEELFGLWQCGNYSNYVASANCGFNGGIMFANAKPLLKQIIENAEEVISSKSKGVNLRFAHDGNLIPLTLLLHLDGFYESSSEPSEFYKVWSNFKVSPMAANIQLIFFRKKGTDDILVKFLHNENEVLVPPVKSGVLPYYHWKDIKDFYTGLLN